MQMPQESNIHYFVKELSKPIRADKVLADAFPEWSRQQLQALFDQNAVFCNKQLIAKKTRVYNGQCISFSKPVHQPTKIFPVDEPIDILYEDDHLIAINKASGEITYPGVDREEITLVHRLLHYTEGKLCKEAGSLRPGVVHRLDRETTGVMLFAKTNQCYQQLIRLFANRMIRKEYWALAKGSPILDSGVICQPIGRHPFHRKRMTVRANGKPSETHWKVLKRFSKEASLLQCFPQTGRTHQIRVHLADCKHPLLGDALYAKKTQNENYPHFFLHAKSIQFTHLLKEQVLTIQAPLAADFKKQLTRLETDYKML